MLTKRKYFVFLKKYNKWVHLQLLFVSFSQARMMAGTKSLNYYNLLLHSSHRQHTHKRFIVRRCWHRGIQKREREYRTFHKHLYFTSQYLLPPLAICSSWTVNYLHKQNAHFERNFDIKPYCTSANG